MVAVEYVQNANFIETNTKTNVVVASFCMSYAQLKLWGVMNLLGPRVLYHDTDLVIYTKSTRLWEPLTGQYLGDLTNELLCGDVGCSRYHLGHWIVEFVSCRAKKLCLPFGFGVSHMQS